MQGKKYEKRLRLHASLKAAIFPAMHFSRYISQSHSTFSLLAALLLRPAR